MSAQILHFSPMSEMPNRIRELRLARGKSQQALGDAIGVSKMMISDLERGNSPLTVDYMRRIAKVFGIDPADLLIDDDAGFRLTEDERMLIERYRSVPEEQQEQFQQVMEVVVRPYRSRDAA